MGTLKDTLRSEILQHVKTKLPEFSVSEHQDTSFSKLGLDSMGHVELSTVIENTTGLTVEPDIAFNYPTVNALVAFVCESLLPERETDDASA